MADMRPRPGAEGHNRCRLVVQAHLVTQRREFGFGEEAGDGHGQSRTGDRRIVVAAAEHEPATRGGGEHEGTRQPRAHPGGHPLEHDVEVLVGGILVTDVELHGGTDRHRRHHLQRPPLALGGLELVDDEVAHPRILGSDGHSQLHARQREAAFGLLECGHHLLGAQSGRRAGQRLQQEALTVRDRQGRPDRSAGGADQGRHFHVTADHDPDGTALVDPAVEQKPGRTGRRRPGGHRADNWQVGQQLARVGCEVRGREGPGVGEQQSDHVVATAAWQAHDLVGFGPGHDLEVEGPSAQTGDAGCPHSHCRPLIAAPAGGDHPGRRGPENGGRWQVGMGGEQRLLGVLGVLRSDEDEHEVRGRAEPGE